MKTGITLTKPMPQEVIAQAKQRLEGGEYVEAVGLLTEGIMPQSISGKCQGLYHWPNVGRLRIGGKDSEAGSLADFVNGADSTTL